MGLIWLHDVWQMRSVEVVHAFPPYPLQVTADVESGVVSSLAWVLEEPEARGPRFLNLYYSLLQTSAKHGQVEGMFRCLRGLAKSATKQGA